MNIRTMECHFTFILLACHILLVVFYFNCIITVCMHTLVLSGCRSVDPHSFFPAHACPLLQKLRHACASSVPL